MHERQTGIRVFLPGSTIQACRASPVSTIAVLGREPRGVVLHDLDSARAQLFELCDEIIHAPGRLRLLVGGSGRAGGDHDAGVAAGLVGVQASTAAVNAATNENMRRTLARAQRSRKST
jgi:hypothetical protein